MASLSTTLDHISRVNTLRPLMIEVEQQAIVNPFAQTTYRVIMESLRSRPGGALEVRKMIAGLPEVIRLRIRRSGPLAISELS